MANVQQKSKQTTKTDTSWVFVDCIATPIYHQLNIASTANTRIDPLSNKWNAYDHKKSQISQIENYVQNVHERANLNNSSSLLHDSLLLLIFYFGKKICD